jgi:hypothetical protein
MVGRSNTTNVGGAAAQEGISYQNRVAAWFAVRILAEEAVSRPWDFPERPEFLRCETEQPVDDLLLGLSGSAFAFVQVKHRLRLETDEASPLGETLNQFVRQFLVPRSLAKVNHPWERPLTPESDRLVSISSPTSSAAIQRQLPSLLERIRNSPIDLAPENATVSKEETHVLAILMHHVRRSWHAQLGHDPALPDLRAFLSLLRFEILDIDAGGSAEREAKDILQSIVLEGAADSNASWVLLIDFCADLAKNHSGADRKELLRLLHQARVPTRVPKSYAADIEHLRKHASDTAKALHDLSVIRLRGKEIKIHRESTKYLYETAEKVSVLVIGDPGAGKSGALHDLVQALQTEKRDHIFLVVDRLDVASLAQINSELGLTHNLQDVLSNWPGSGPAFVVIDALDAARAESAAKAMRDLIAGILDGDSRWHLVVSIRKFDLRYNEELKRLFHRTDRNSPSSGFEDPEFQAFSHVKIPTLTDSEISEVSEQSTELGALINRISSDLSELLRVPFNLRLLAQLVQEGITPEELEPVRTQLQLLDKYWNYRILRPPEQAHAHELFLNRVCEGMINSRTLRVEWKVVADAAVSGALNHLLSNHVLTEWQPVASSTPDRSLLMFSHHVLFDYAVARLVLRGDPAKLLERLANNGELAIVIRPSFLYHFRYLWTSDPDHHSFWELTFQIARNPAVPEIAKIIGPTVAAELLHVASDLDQLCVWLQSDGEDRDVGEALLDHVVGAALVNPSSILENSEPWCGFLDRVSGFFRRRSAYSVNALLFAVLEIFPSLSSRQKASAGITSRRLLEFAWAQSPRDGWLVIQALRGVSRTFDTDEAASGTLLRKALTPNHVAAFGFEELSWLARGVKEFASSDPSLVEEIYAAAFLYQERSEEPTPMGPSRIFTLVSNKRQDFEMARFQLAQLYPDFLRRAPEHATRAMIVALEGYISRERNADEWHNKENEQTFKFDKYVAHFRADYSSIWDSGFHTEHVEALQILSAFFDWLESILGDTGLERTVNSVLAILAENNHAATIWRRLLQMGTSYPETLGMKIVPLAEAVPILTAYDTTTAAGEYLKVIFPLLTTVQREHIEDVVLSLPQKDTKDKPEYLQKLRNRLLGCLPVESLCGQTTRDLVEQLRTTQAIPKNEPAVEFTGPSFRQFGEEEYLREQGVPVDAEANKRIRSLSGPVTSFASEHNNSTPSSDEVLEATPLMMLLHEALESAQQEGAHERQLDHAWGQLAEACERVSRLVDFSCSVPTGAFVRKTLLEASTQRVPESHPDQDKQFDESPSWGGPAARISAAQGLSNLCRNKDCADSEVLSALERLSADPVPAVRFQIVIRLNALYETNRDLMWRLIQERSNTDQSRGVLDGLVNLLERLGGHHPDTVAGVLVVILRRFENEPKVKLRESCLAVLSSLYVWRDQLLSKRVTLEAAGNPAGNTSALWVIASRLRNVLSHGPVEPNDPAQNAIRRRAFDLLQRVLGTAISAVDTIQATQTSPQFESWSPEIREQMKSLLQVVSHVAKEIYFASGAFSDNQQGRASTSRPVASPERRRFYFEAQPLLEQLANVGLPAISHTLLETLESFIEIDPRGVFLRVSKTVRESRPGGYQYESMAVDLIVRIVERYLAEYRLLFQQDEDCRRALVEVLDLFVKAGWPAARRITYRLEEIFR